MNTINCSSQDISCVRIPIFPSKVHTPFATQKTKIQSCHIEAKLILNMVQALHFCFRIYTPYLLHIDIFKQRMDTGSEHFACQDNRLTEEKSTYHYINMKTAHFRLPNLPFIQLNLVV